MKRLLERLRRWLFGAGCPQCSQWCVQCQRNTKMILSAESLFFDGKHPKLVMKRCSKCAFPVDVEPNVLWKDPDIQKDVVPLGRIELTESTGENRVP